MRFITFLVLSFVLITCHPEVYGQKGYESGYIITNNSDTISGIIKDRKPPPFGKIYKKIYFKAEKSRKKKYGPHQIKGYRQGNRFYKSMWLNVSYDFFKQKYTSSPNVGEQQFLKLIVQGYLSFYQLEFEDQESDYVDAVDLYKRSDENSLVRVTQGIFGIKKKKLAAYFQDCPELVRKIEAGEMKDPVEIAYYYNHWKEN
ncbi:MAG: hypothetical protein QNK30_12230 [Bacteroidales bacterium]|nr:hypothetical protein [Bacteroidales bacterium]